MIFVFQYVLSRNKRHRQVLLFEITDFDFDLLFNVHGKHLRSCRDGQLT